MSSFLASVSLLLRSFSRRGILLLLLALVVIFFLLDSSPNSPSQLALPTDTPSTPFKPSSCEADAYPKGSFLRNALTPPLALPGLGPAWASENHKQFKELCTCLQNESCSENQDKVVILNSNHFGAWYSNSKDGTNGGESIWATSTGTALRQLNYTYLFGSTQTEVVEMHNALSAHVLGIIANDDFVFPCFEDTTNCVKSRQNPNGLPIWKLFTFHFWSQATHPLGEKWTLSPENYKSASPDGKGNTFLGYSVEPSCMVQEFIPHVDRPRGQAYAMAKRLSYFAEQPNRAWPLSFYSVARKRIQTPGGVHFVIGAHNDTDFAEQWGVKIPEMPKDAVTNLGIMDQKRFMQEVARSRVLVGVGHPALSPTPYQALCLGVPFINPIIMWDKENPNYRGRWLTQHDGLRNLDPPYVYNVFKEDEAGFISAVRRAIENPIDRYIPPQSTTKAVADRLHAILRTDWRREAEAVLAERIRTKKGERFAI